MKRLKLPKLILLFFLPGLALFFLVGWALYWLETTQINKQAFNLES